MRVDGRAIASPHLVDCTDRNRSCHWCDGHIWSTSAPVITAIVSICSAVIMPSIEDMSWPWEVSIATGSPAVAGAALATAGHNDEAIGVLTEAVSIHSATGAFGDIELAEAALRRLGARRSWWHRPCR